MIEGVLVQGLLGTVKPIQLYHEFADTLMEMELEKMPVESMVVVPLGSLPELAAHKQQLGARMGIHISIQQPEVSKSLPFITRHPTNQRPFTVHHLVV